MRSSTILTLGLAAVATSSPLAPRADGSGNYWEVSNFVFGCTTTCDWSFDVTVHGSSANHPEVLAPVTCSGSTTKQDYKTCSKIGNSDTRSVAPYIDENNKLRLPYQVQKPKQGARYDYYGHKHVNAETSGKPQKKQFKVQESSATGVA